MNMFQILLTSFKTFIFVPCFITLFKLYKLSVNVYIDIIISQDTTQFYAQYVQYISQLHVSAHFRPSSGCSLQPSECGSLKTLSLGYHTR